jgi:transcription elongation factor GreA
MSEPVYLTEEGRESLQRELDILITVRRPELARKLKEAVAQGDLKENADYHDTREQQSFVEGRIQYLENLLLSAVVIENNGNLDYVTIGSTVVIKEDGGDEDEEYMIVGPAEADPRTGKISHESPIGKALIGRKKGDKVRVETPAGQVIFTLRKLK